MHHKKNGICPEFSRNCGGLSCPLLQYFSVIKNVPKTTLSLVTRIHLQLSRYSIFSTAIYTKTQCGPTIPIINTISARPFYLKLTHFIHLRTFQSEIPQNANPLPLLNRGHGKLKPVPSTDSSPKFHPYFNFLSRNCGGMCPRHKEHLAKIIGRSCMPRKPFHFECKADPRMPIAQRPPYPT